MRRVWVGCIVVVLAGIIAIVLAGTAGCEDEESQQQSASTQPEGPSQPQFQRLRLATQPATLPMPPPDWKPSTEPSFSATAPTTLNASTQSSSSSAAASDVDPLADPESAVRYFFEMCVRRDLPDMQTMRGMIVEPPPDAELAPILDKVRRRLLILGATWEIVQSHKRGPAAVVIYKTTYRGRSLGGVMTLYQGRDDRWRLIFGDLTAARYTPGEKNAMSLEAAWAKQRLGELNAELAASQPTTAQATTTQPAAP